MEFDKINKLLEKYWAGESSLEEEQILKKYFQKASIAEEYRAFASLFQFFVEEENQKVSTEFDEKLLQQLTEDTTEIKGTPLPAKQRGLLFYLPRIAAVIALVVAAWFVFQKPADPILAEVDQQEIEEAKVAYKQAKAALLLLSTKLNKGTNAAVNGLQELDRATDVVRGKNN